ncbi:MAG: hypothetical protein EA365_00425, partial [Gloeocapsa sp. DLM2.Bin57]
TTDTVENLELTTDSCWQIVTVENTRYEIKPFSNNSEETESTWVSQEDLAGKYNVINEQEAEETCGESNIGS